MKDEMHHRKQVQKKVVQSVRKSESREAKLSNGVSSNNPTPKETKSVKVQKNSFVDKKDNDIQPVPRIISHPQYH